MDLFLDNCDCSFCHFRFRFVNIFSLSSLSSSFFSLFSSLLVLRFLAQVLLHSDRPREVNTCTSEFQQTVVFSTFESWRVETVIEFHVDDDFSILANADDSSTSIAEFGFIHAELISIRFLIQVNHIDLNIRHLIDGDDFNTACRFTRLKTGNWLQNKRIVNCSTSR